MSVSSVALVTGATTGIGKETSLSLARAGHAVVVSGRRKEAGEAVVREIRDNGGEATFVAADVDSEESVAALIAATVERYGRLDVAVNNAGVSLDTGRLADEPTSAFQQMLTTNVLGVFWGMKHQIQQMLAQGNPGGAVINLASIAGLGGIRYAANYSATKHAVVGLTKSAALEYATDNIRINGVAPAAVKTDILANAIESGTWDEATIAALQPVNRMGRPEEIAAAITWLASPAASFVTGTILNVDGGYKAQ
ncbi:short-chain dehydrogenase [Streptomyces sp. MMG1533]|uniref:glucose 1-dehydrogenase n=1 Tax=Streptomyces sp. MMG1533 TaxID=1415546 RepID=UPI0006ADD92A|nr:glucose 1-dehydrogenase [Streptomyces sp. MMG1533]KOU66825.1 short-chain dehydrogenase [Streptomyces sp. MMG1533]